MNTWQFYLGFFGVLYVLVFVVDYFFINLRKYNLMFKKAKNTKKKLTKKSTKKKEVKEFGEVNYLVGKFKLDKKKINYKSVILWTAIINSFIISFVSTVISAIPAHMIWQLLVGFVLIFALIYSLYEIYGRILVKKGWGKDE
ncbi:MAG: hypothetical protein IJN03_00090 [Bacilli bacterium]|nr:hypothetical protein [Bacilli bacterium]